VLKVLKIFIPVMLCQQKSEPFNDGGWIFEKKLDGIRCVFRIDFEENYLFIQNRHTISNLAKVFPEFSLDLLKKTIPNIKSVILDGEIVNGDGKTSDYHNPNFKTRTHIQSVLRAKFLSRLFPLNYFVFDILFLNGEDLRNKPLMDRKKILNEVIKETERVKIVKFVESNGKEFYQKMLENGFEGMVCKDRNSIYENKRSPSWIKVKPILKMVVGVLDYKETSGWGSFGALITPNGDVSFNSELERQEYFRRKKLGKVNIEVRYQELIPESNKFRFPKFNKFI